MQSDGMKSRSLPREFPRLPFLEGLRGLAALYVMFGHLASIVDPSALAGRKSEVPPVLHFIFGLVGQGHLAVAAFIVLSGFCLQISLFNGGDGRVAKPSRFFLRRAERILPAYWASLALSLAVTVGLAPSLPGMPFDIYRPVTWDSLIGHVLLVHNWSLDWMYKINGVLWSIALEAQLYLTLPFIVVGVYRWGRSRVLGVVSVVAATTLLLPNAPKLYGWFLALFALGIILAHASYRPSLQQGANPRLGLIASLLAFVITVALVWTNAPIYLSDSTMGVAVGSLCYGLTTSPQGILHKLFEARALVWAGAFSYSLYLIHHPLLQVAFAVRPAWTTSPLALTGYLMAIVPLVILGSIAFAIVFEAPFVRNRHPSALNRLPVSPVSLPLQVSNGALD